METQIILQQLKAEVDNIYEQCEENNKLMLQILQLINNKEIK